MKLSMPLCSTAVHSKLVPLVTTALMLLAFASGKAAPANDDLAHAQVIKPGSFSVNGTEDGATEEAFEKSSSFPFPYATGAKTVWYSYTPDVDGTLTIEPINTSGNADGTVIIIFKGPRTPSSSTFLIANAAAKETVTTPVTANQQYLIQIGNNAPFAHAFTLIGTFVAPVTLPVVTVTVPKPEAIRSTGAAGEVLVELSSAPEASLEIAYTLAGTAINGTDYALLRESVTVPAGAKTAVIKIKPKRATMGQRIVKLAVAAGKGYLLGSPHRGKVTIVESK